MDAQRFDAFAKALAATRVSRRTVLTALAGVVAGGPRSVARPAGSLAVDAAPSSAQDDDWPACGDFLDPCGPIDNLSCCDVFRCEVCDVPSGQCRSRCQGIEVCCDGDCRTDIKLVCDDICCSPEASICCGSICVNGQTDRVNCGECGIQCAEDEICDRGTCRGCYSLCESLKDGRCISACAADEFCDPERGCLPRQIDTSTCETLLAEADLLALVTGGTSVTSLTSFEGEDDQGSLTLLCVWDVVGNPQAAEPWFDWLVSVQAALKVRIDVSLAEWEDGLDAIDAGLDCAPAELPSDRTPVCLSERPGAVDLSVRPDPDRFLWLLLTSSKTGDAPDYPALREATERIAAFLIAKLNPASPKP